MTKQTDARDCWAWEKSFTALPESGTCSLANRLVPVLRHGCAVGLIGPLGAGKTAFVRYFAAACGCSEPVSSPSYVLQHEYRLPEGGILEHWDLYRLDDLPPELVEPTGPSTLRLIEWADKVPEFLRSLDVLICISVPPSREASHLRDFHLKAKTTLL